MARSHFYIGLAAALFAIVVYGILNVIVQSRRIEVEDSLLASNAVLEKLVGLDSLTDIANRRAFNERLEHEFAVSTRTHQPVSLLMVDVEWFKSLNDTIGYIAGDEYLVQIAAALDSKLSRTTDFLARYGGEEFVVILPATDAGGAMIAAERARKGVAELSLKHSTVPAGFVTVSIGVSTHDGSTSCSTIDLTDSADRALYKAKRNGRNRSEFRRMDSHDSGIA